MESMDYAAQLLAGLADLWHKQLHCDVVITTETTDQVFHTHKAVMCAASPYFSEVLATRHEEQDDHVHRLMTDASPDLLQHVLTFLYTGGLDLTTHCVLDVLLLAEQWQLPSMVAACYKFISIHKEAMMAEVDTQETTLHNCPLHGYSFINISPVLKQESVKNVKEEQSNQELEPFKCSVSVVECDVLKDGKDCSLHYLYFMEDPTDQEATVPGRESPQETLDIENLAEQKAAVSGQKSPPGALDLGDLTDLKAAVFGPKSPPGALDLGDLTDLKAAVSGQKSPPETWDLGDLTDLKAAVSVQGPPKVTWDMPVISQVFQLAGGSDICSGKETCTVTGSLPNTEDMNFIHVPLILDPDDTDFCSGLGNSKLAERLRCHPALAYVPISSLLHASRSPEFQLEVDLLHLFPQEDLPIVEVHKAETIGTEPQGVVEQQFMVACDIIGYKGFRDLWNLQLCWYEGPLDTLWTKSEASLAAWINSVTKDYPNLNGVVRTAAPGRDVCVRCPYRHCPTEAVYGHRVRSLVQHVQTWHVGGEPVGCTYCSRCFTSHAAGLGAYQIHLLHAHPQQALQEISWLRSRPVLWPIAHTAERLKPMPHFSKVTSQLREWCCTVVFKSVVLALRDNYPRKLQQLRLKHVKHKVLQPVRYPSTRAFLLKSKRGRKRKNCGMCGCHGNLENSLGSPHGSSTCHNGHKPSKKKKTKREFAEPWCGLDMVVECPSENLSPARKVLSVAAMATTTCQKRSRKNGAHRGFRNHGNTKLQQAGQK